MRLVVLLTSRHKMPQRLELRALLIIVVIPISTHARPLLDK